MLEYDENAHRPVSRAHAARRRDRSVDEAALREQAARARRVREEGRHLDGRAVAASCPRSSASVCCTPTSAATRESFPSCAISRRSATSSTSASSCASIRPRRNARPVTAPSSSRTSLQVRVGGRNIAEVSELSRRRAASTWLDALELSAFEQQVAAHILKEARDRVQFLCDVGSQLPLAQSRDAHALRRRSAAHRPRELARLAARRHALRARRAVDRPAFARHGPAARAAASAARRRQHGARRRARPRGDPRRGLHGGARARTAARRAASSCSPDPMSRVGESPLTGAVSHRRA